MADSNKFGIRWGWVGLILIVAVIGGAWLYQREGGRIFGPQPSPKTESPPRTEPKPASDQGSVLAVTVRRQKDFQADCRIYLDGTLVAVKPAPYDVYKRDGMTRVEFGPEIRVLRGNSPIAKLTEKVKDGINAGYVATDYFDGDALSEETVFRSEPGTHKLETAIRVYPLGKRENGAYENCRVVFPFTFHAYSVEVAADKKTRAQIKANASFSYEGHGIYGSRQYEWNPGSSTPFDVDLQEFETVTKRILSNVETDPIVHELKTVYETLKRIPPKKPLIDLSLPDKYGGGRQYDAEMIRILVDWLEYRYWAGIPDGPLEPIILNNRKPFLTKPGTAEYDMQQAETLKSWQRLKPRFIELEMTAKLSRQALRQYKAIAVMLEQAR